jgi:hypothetical protein
MIYLKSYKIFESISDEIDDIKDIYQELIDDRFNIHIKNYNKSSDIFSAYEGYIERYYLRSFINNPFIYHEKPYFRDIIYIKITKDAENLPYDMRNRSEFKYDEVSEYFERSIDYMTSNGWNHVIENRYNGSVDGSVGLQYDINCINDMLNHLEKIKRDLTGLYIIFYK